MVHTNNRHAHFHFSLTFVCPQIVAVHFLRKRTFVSLAGIYLRGTSLGQIDLWSHCNPIALQVHSFASFRGRIFITFMFILVDHIHVQSRHYCLWNCKVEFFYINYLRIYMRMCMPV